MKLNSKKEKKVLNKNSSTTKKKLKSSDVQLKGISLRTRKELEVIKQSADETSEFAESIINTVREPLIVLDKDLRVVTVSRSFYGFFKVKPEETVGQLIYDLGNKQWDIPKLRELLETILPQKTTFDNYEVEHDFATIGRRTMLLNARQIQRVMGKERIILLAIEDITERKHVNEELQSSEIQYRSLTENSPDLIARFDRQYRHLYVNPAAAKAGRYSPNEYVGKTIAEVGVPEEEARKWEGRIRTVFETGQIVDVEDSFETPNGSRNFHTKFVPEFALDWSIHSVQSIARDITERKLSEVALRESEVRFRELFNHMSSGVAVYEAIDNGGDFIFRDFNPAAEKIEKVSRKDILGKRVTEVFPGVKAFGVFEVFQRVWQTGKPEYFPENIYKDERDPGSWRESWVFKLPTGEIVAVYNNITKRKRMEEHLAYQANLLANVSDAVIASDDRFILTVWNRAAENMFGWKSEEVLGRSGQDVFRSEFIGIERSEVLRRVMETGEFRGEVIQYRKDGTSIYVEANTYAMKNENGQITGYVTVSRDITERKQAEEAIRESEEKHKALIETTDTGYLILDAQGRVIDANKEYIRLTGYDTLDEILGRNVVEWTAPHDSERNAIEVKKCAEQGYIRNLEIDYINRSEQITPIEINATVVGSGDSVRILSLCRDITERKRAEEALRLEKENFRRSLDESPLGVRIVTVDGDTLYANRAILDFYGYDSLEELRKTPLRARYTPESYAEFQKRKQQRELSDFSTSEYEISIVRKNGEVLHLQIHRKEVLWNNAKQFLVMYQDITERKRAEEEKIKLLRVLEASLNEIYIFDISTFKFSYVNDAARHNIGYTFEEIKELTPLDLNPEFTENTFREKVAPLLRGESVVLVFQTVHRRKDRSLYPIEVHLQIVHSGVEKVFLAMIYDITERRRAEEELRQEKDFAEGMIETAQAIVLVLDTQGRIVRFNPYMEEISGYAQAEVQGKDWFTTFLPERDRERIRNLFLKALSDIQTRGNVNPIVTKDGRECEIEWNDKTLRDLQGNIVGVLSIGQDITERKRAQEQITMLAYAVRSINECVSITDTNNNIVFVNRAFLDTYGYTEQELLGKNINLVRSSKISDEDGERIRLSTLEGMWHGELMNKRKDGSEFPIFLSTTMVRDNKGEPIALIGVATDITERKREEEEISKSHEELRMLANHLQNIREEERNHLAREFHDQIGQSMTALKMDLSLLLRMISDEKQDVQRKLVAEELQSMQKLVDETSQLLWAIITELRPVMLDDLGLIATFEWESQQFESRTGITCEFKSSEKNILLDPKKSIALFRIYQEALTNITRHANATVVKSVLRRDNEMLVLEIKDNGCGISIDKKLKPESFGLISMRERSVAIGGLLEINGIAGEGTTIIVRLPLGQVDEKESTSK